MLSLPLTSDVLVSVVTTSEHRVSKVTARCIVKIQLTCFNCCSPGGLVTAVAPVVIDCGGLWIGWSGLHTKEPLESIPESDPDDKAPTAGLLSKQVNRRTASFV